MYLENLVVDAAEPQRLGRFWEAAIGTQRLTDEPNIFETRFWSWLTGWPAVPDAGRPCLRHPSGRGPLLELRPERAPKGTAKNRRHLDVRLEAGEDADEIAAAIAARGGREFRLTDAPVPWRTYADPSGNEFCVLPACP